MNSSSYRSFLALVSSLSGNPPEKLEWDEIIALANQSLTITSLAAVLTNFPNMQVPDDVQGYLSTVLARNTERNCKLTAQLSELAGCLNRNGIEPVVMKGAAFLTGQQPTAPGARLLTDLDIFVRPEDMSKAIAALLNIGYQIRIHAGQGSWPGNPKFHLPVVLDRPGDAGSIDLQCRPRGPASFGDIEWLYRNSRRSTLEGRHLHVPTAFAQIVFLLLHDVFQDGDYWRGLFDLRHLLDIAHLARTEEIDWHLLRSLFAAGYERNAVDTQILTAHALFRIDGASEFYFGRIACLQFARRRFQFGRHHLAKVLTLFTLLTEIVHFPSWDRFGGEPYPSRKQEAHRKLRELRRIFRPVPVGKL
ncbi:hypothetical protein EHS39_25510 [Ensifer sp. MPMI2T]|nr:hypothetical protein EHS39_25510 [Ensifer sp. MPMI2T]